MARMRTRDLADKIDSMDDFELDLAVFVLQNIADERAPMDSRMKYAMELMPYLYAKKKDIVVDGNVSGELNIRWMTSEDDKK